MAGSRLGSVFVEISLDDRVYKERLSQIKPNTEATAKGLETSWRSLGVKTNEYFDNSRKAAENAYQLIQKSGKYAADEIIRAEQAKNAKIQSLNEQQFGRQTSLIDGLKKNWIAAAAVIGTAMVAASKAWDMVKMGADFEEQRGILDNLSRKYGTTADGIVTSMEKASDGLVARADLMKIALGGLAKGLDPTQMTNLSDAARILGDVVGKDATTALNDLSEALESGKTKALKGYLGTAIDLEATFGKLYEKLTEAEKAQALYNITMMEAGKLQGVQTKAVDETADSIERLEARWKNLNTTMSQWAKAGFVSLADTVDRLAGGNLTQQDVITDSQGRQHVYQKNTFGGDLDDIAMPKGAATSDAYQKSLDAMKKKVAGRDTTKADSEAKKAADEIKKLRADSLKDLIASIEAETKEYEDGLRAQAGATEASLKERKDLLAEDLKGYFDGVEARTKAETEALIEADKLFKETNANRLKASRDIYKDLRGYEDQQYAATLELIQEQAEEYRKLGVSEVSINAWVTRETENAWVKNAKASDKFFDGVKAGYVEMQRDATKFGKAGTDIFDTFSKSSRTAMSSILFDSFKTGTFDATAAWGAFTDSMGKRFSDTLSDMVFEAAANQVVMLFESKWSENGANVLGTINSVLGIAGDLFGGSPGVGGESGGAATAGGYEGGSYAGFAKGGQMPAGKPAWVGEEGPELIFPTSGGYVLPHKQSVAYAAMNGGHIPGYAAGGPILPGVMSTEQVYEFIRALGWKDITNTNQWIDPTGMAPLPMRFMTQWGSITPVEAPLTFDATEYGYPATVRAMETRPDVGYISHGTGTNMPLVAQIVDAALSIAVPAWGIVSGAGKVGMGAGTGDSRQALMGLIQAGASAYSAYNIGAGGYADAGMDVSGAGMGGAGEGATWFTARQAFLAAASPVVKNAVANQALGMIAKAFGGDAPSASINYKGFDDGGMLANLSSMMGSIAPQSYQVPVYHNGIDYVPRTGPAILERGEKVTPAGQNGGGVVIQNLQLFIGGKEFEGEMRVIADGVVVARNSRGVNPTQRVY